MTAADSSVAVAAFSSWHPQREAARQALDRVPWIVSHAAVETYSVLTRAPDLYRAPASLVLEWLESVFGARWLGLSADAQRLALERLHALGVDGGATYDGLIAITAAASGATLVTLDKRALKTYALVGADVKLVG